MLIELGPRPGRVVRTLVVSLLLASPTILLVAGALLIGMSGSVPSVGISQAQVVSITDPELGVGESEYDQTSLINNVPAGSGEPAQDGGQPILVSIEDLAVRSPVIPVASYGGVMEIPEEITTIGWYSEGASPGSEQGSAVLVGHRDGVEEGRGAFYGIEELDSGDRITVTLSDGNRLKYVVNSVSVVDKDEIPAMADYVFATDGDPRLTLITCGGAYERDDGGYQANVIVTALPAN